MTDRTLPSPYRLMSGLKITDTRYSEISNIKIEHDTAALDNAELGKLGERALFNFLENRMKIYLLESGDALDYLSISWENEFAESYSPYDLSIRYNDKREHGRVYIDAKTTRYHEQTHIFMSLDEIRFMLNTYESKEDHYLIARIFLKKVGKTYRGIGIHGEFGMLLYRLNNEGYEELKNLLPELREHYQVKNIQIKPSFFEMVGTQKE